jgi:hypothetical protein
MRKLDFGESLPKTSACIEEPIDELLVTIHVSHIAFPIASICEEIERTTERPLTGSTVEERLAEAFAFAGFASPATRSGYQGMDPQAKNVPTVATY